MRASPNVAPMVAFGLVAVACLAPAPARAQDPATADKEKRQRLERQFQESLGWYQVSASPNSGVMKPRPVLRWLNPTRGQKGEPTLILWTDAGRPQALASVYPWGTILTYECVSLRARRGPDRSGGGPHGLGPRRGRRRLPRNPRRTGPGSNRGRPTQAGEGAG